MNITVCIPSIPERRYYLQKALRSVVEQTYQPSAISVAIDKYRIGAIETRNTSVSNVSTEWIAFLDDDDEFLPFHLERLADCAQETDADYVYSYFTIQDHLGNEIPDTILGNFGKPFDPQNPMQTTMTVLVKTELVHTIGGFREPPPGATINGQRFGEDYQFTLDCLREGAKIVHLPEKTWIWRHHQRNTSGIGEIAREKYERNIR